MGTCRFPIVLLVARKCSHRCLPACVGRLTNEVVHNSGRACMAGRLGQAAATACCKMLASTAGTAVAAAWLVASAWNSACTDGGSRHPPPHHGPQPAVHRRRGWRRPMLPRSAIFAASTAALAWARLYGACRSKGHGPAWTHSHAALPQRKRRRQRPGCQTTSRLRGVQTSWQCRNCRWSIALCLCRNTTPALLQAASSSRQEGP